MLDGQPWGQRWRSSQAFIIFTATLGLFTETFQDSFIVPIRLTTALLTTHGLVMIAAAPIIGHFADKTSNRKAPFLLALAASAVGTVLVALCPSVWILFMGRIIQAMSGSAAWIIAYATLIDNVNKDQIGGVLGTSMSFVTAGMVTGPTASGALLQLLGYGAAWSAPFLLLATDFLARLVMIERGQKLDSSSEHANADEEEALIRPNTHQDDSDASPDDFAPPPASFYKIVLLNAQAIVALLNTVTFSMILSGFDTTLPLHLQRTFHWDTLPIGMMFLGIQVPGMIIGPIVGRLRDRVGLRYPTTIGWILLAILLWVLGVPGSGIEWTEHGSRGQVIFIAGIIAIGTVAPLVRGAGMYQLIAITNELQVKNPDIFGPHGGSSRLISMTEIAFSTGVMLGPLLSGSLVEAFGFSRMTGVLGGLSLVIGLSSFTFLTRKSPKPS